MNVLVLSHMYPDNHNPQFGIFIRREVEALTKYCRLNVVSPRPWIPGNGRYVPAGNTKDYKVYYPFYFPLPGALFNPLKGWWFFLFMVRTVLCIRKKFTFDIIHAHRVYPDGFAAVLLGKLMKKPVVISARGSDINVLACNFIIRRLIKYAFIHAQKIITVSKTLAEKIVATGIPEEKVYLMPKGVDTEMFYPQDRQKMRNMLSIPQDKVVVLYMGNLVAVKNPLAVVEAAVALTLQERESLHFIMVGDGGLRKRIEQIIKEKGLVDSFSLIGRVDPSQVGYWMNAADVLVLPSLNEGMPNVLYEAMACGLPVIASNVGGVPEIIEEGITGFLVDVSDLQELKNRILTCAKDRPLRERIGRNSRMYIEKRKLNWDENAKKIVMVYQKAGN